MPLAHLSEETKTILWRFAELGPGFLPVWSSTGATTLYNIALPAGVTGALQEEAALQPSSSFRFFHSPKLQGSTRTPATPSAKEHCLRLSLKSHCHSILKVSWGGGARASLNVVMCVQGSVKREAELENETEAEGPSGRNTRRRGRVTVSVFFWPGRPIFILTSLFLSREGPSGELCPLLLFFVLSACLMFVVVVRIVLCGTSSCNGWVTTCARCLIPIHFFFVWVHWVILFIRHDVACFRAEYQLMPASLIPTFIQHRAVLQGC